MLEINTTAKFKKDYRRCLKRGYDLRLLKAVVNTLRIPALLPPENKDHILVGNFVGHRECHIQSDWLLRNCKEKSYPAFFFTVPVNSEGIFRNCPCEF